MSNEETLLATVNTDIVAEIEAEAQHLITRSVEDDRPKAQGFPIYALPDGLQRIAENLRDTIGFPIDYTASAMLFTASVAVGTSLGLSPKRGWVEPATLWLALVGRPGANKTHPLTMMLKPLHARDRESVQAYASELKDYEAELKQSKKDKDREVPTPPTCAQHLVVDTTPEALAEVLGKNPRGIGLHRDELSGWVADFGRYSQGGEAQGYMSMWSAQPLRVNRVKTSKPLYVHRPFVSVCGTIQPGVLGGLVTDGRGVNGFIDRMLFAFPEEQAMAAWSEEEPADWIAAYWDQFITKLVSIPPPDEGTDPIVLKFTTEAKRLWAKHYAKMKTEIDGLNKDGDEARAGHRTKMLSYTLRFALLDAAMQWASGDGHDVPVEVDIASLGAAITLAEYYTTTSDKVLFTLHDSTPVDALRGRKLDLFQALPTTFTTAKAILIGERIGITRRSVERYLGDGKIYQRHRDGGEYTKRHEG
jgi:hypothetical protein